MGEGVLSFLNETKQVTHKKKKKKNFHGRLKIKHGESVSVNFISTKPKCLYLKFENKCYTHKSPN